MSAVKEFKQLEEDAFSVMGNQTAQSMGAAWRFGRCAGPQTPPASFYRFTAAAAGGGQPRPVLRRDMALVERIFDARDPVGIQLHPGTLTGGAVWDRERVYCALDR